MYSYVHIQICIPLLLKTHKGYGTEVWSGEKIAFNYGREIFVYPYKGVKKAADLTKPIDKRIYKVMLQRLNVLRLQSVALDWVTDCVNFKPRVSCSKQSLLLLGAQQL